MILKSLADITGDAATHALATDGTKGKWVQFFADPANGASIRVGGADTASGQGLPIQPGAYQFLPPISDHFEFYDFSKIFYYAGTGDKLYVGYTQEGSNS